MTGVMLVMLFVADATNQELSTNTDRLMAAEMPRSSALAMLIVCFTPFPIEI